MNGKGKKILSSIRINKCENNVCDDNYYDEKHVNANMNDSRRVAMDLHRLGTAGLEDDIIAVIATLIMTVLITPCLI